MNLIKLKIIDFYIFLYYRRKKPKPLVTNESENDEPNVTPPPSPEGDDNVSIYTL